MQKKEKRRKKNEDRNNRLSEEHSHVDGGKQLQQDEGEVVPDADGQAELAEEVDPQRDVGAPVEAEELGEVVAGGARDLEPMVRF
jgi:hypothetical protein